jgi:microcin C transport system substrate-binding protein
MGIQIHFQALQTSRGSSWYIAMIAACSLPFAFVACTPDRDSDDRFPPYDNTAEVEAEWRAKPELYRFKTLADLPQDLKWETGAELPELGSPEAKKGGTLRIDMPDFPPTLRFVGPDGSNTFRGEHSDKVEMRLVMHHPDTTKWMPGIAEAWAESADKKTAYFRLDPDARFSDGVKVTVEDFFMLFYMSLSKHLQDPFAIDFFSKEYECITKYDDRTMSITMREPKPDAIYQASEDNGPMPRHFFKEFTDDFPARYQWRKMPTTGAYDIAPEDIKYGRSITLTRVKDWWARDKKFYRHRFNVDRIEYRTISSVDTAYEMFRQGKLDMFCPQRFIALVPTYWYDKSEVPEVLNGYIEKYTFYNVYPRLSRGIYLNQSKPPLDNQDVRTGINYALNFERVIQVVLRGDAVRMQSTFSGFGRFTSPKLKATPYDPVKAQAFFAKAGYSKRGGDGVLVNAAGKRLSLTFSIANMPAFTQAALILKEDALKAGFEINLEALDVTQLFKKGDQKTHEMIMSAWGAKPPHPHLWEYYATENAWEIKPDGTRKVKTNTNNFTMTGEPELDRLIDLQRKAPNEDEVQKYSWLVEERVQELGCAIPAWDSPYYRFLHWRWLRWPKNGNLMQTRECDESHVFWIDEDIRAETEQAMRDGRSFGEVSRVYDQHREK